MSSNNMPYTLSKIIDDIGFGFYQVFLIAALSILAACDFMEIIMVALMGPILRCAWNISAYEESLMMSMVFLGMLFGSIFFGEICDKYGRRKVLFLLSFLLIYYGFLCTLVPNIIWFIILRLIIGLAVGGILPLISTLLSELMPTKYRGTSIVFLQGCSSLGTFLVTLLCVLIVPNYSWRIFIFISNIPMLVFLIFFIFLPESPRFLMLHGYKQKALDIINKIAKINKSPEIKDISDDNIKLDYSIWDLIHPNYRLTTIMCLFNWFVSGLSYYGGLLLITYINIIPYQCLQNMSTHNKVFSSTDDDSCCMIISFESFKLILISVIGEFCSLIIPFIFLNLIGRKPTMASLYVIASLSYILLNICMGDIPKGILLIIIRGISFGVFNCQFAYTSEVFPTSVRGIGLGLCSASARVGALLSPFLINLVVIRHSFLTGTLIISILNLIASIGVILLPYETKNRRLMQTANEEINIDLNNDKNYIEIK